MTVKRIDISGVRLNALFRDISNALGFSDEVILSYAEDIDGLMKLWDEQKFVEVYQYSAHRLFGRIKSSDVTPPHYMDLYHARVLYDENDPLLILKFEDSQTGHPILSIRFMADHDDVFGTRKDKHRPDILRRIRQRIAQFIRQGDDV